MPLSAGFLQVVKVFVTRGVGMSGERQGESDVSISAKTCSDADTRYSLTLIPSAFILR